MTRALILATAALAGVALASPAFALSVTPTPPGAQDGPKLADPDEALSGLYKYFAGSDDGPAVRETPILRGPLVTYDLSKPGKDAKPHDGVAELKASPSDPAFNPFMGALSDSDRSPQDH